MCMVSCEVFFSLQSCVLFCCLPLQPNEWPHGVVGLGGGGWGTTGHVKGHLWGFVGPAWDGRGSASGGSNFSKTWGEQTGGMWCLCGLLALNVSAFV